MDKGREPTERLLSSVTSEANNKNNLMLNHHKKLISHCLTIPVADGKGWVTAWWTTGCVQKVRLTIPTYPPEKWPVPETWLTPLWGQSVSSHSRVLLVRSASGRSHLIQTTASQHPPRGPWFHCATLSRTIRIGSISRGAQGQTLAIPPHSGNQRNANETKPRVHSSDFAKLNFFKQK